MKKYTLTILWWTNGFWKWLKEYIFENFWEYCEIRVAGSKDDNIEAVKNVDIVIYSVPISLTQKIIDETLPHIKPWAIVADVTSIKWFTSKAMEKRDDIIVIPTHPMFGPYIKTLAGQVVVLTPHEQIKDTKEYKFLKDFLYSKKVKVREETPKNHDKMMAVVQWLTHLNIFVVAETMKRLEFDVRASEDFISPIYKMMISSVGRYLGQNPGLYSDIQMYNDEILPVHEAFLETAKNFHTTVLQKSSQKFCEDILKTRDFLWDDFCDSGQKYTDNIIDLLGKQAEH